MADFKKIKIGDHLVDRAVYVSFLNALKTEFTTRLVGPNFTGSILDTNFWTTLEANNGTNSVGSGMLLLKTNTDPNGTAGVTSIRRGRFLFACPNIFRGAIRFLDTGTTNNKRKFGAYNGTDGYFFQLNGTTFSIGYSRDGVEAPLINSGSFNGTVASWTVDTNVHAFEIHYFVMKVEYYIDGVLIHTVTPTTATLVANLSLPIYVANINSGGSATDVHMECWNVTILRIGQEHHSKISKNISGAATTVLKYGTGHFDKFFINSSVNGTITIYDNTSAAGTIIATITTPANAVIGIALENINFYIGLTVVTSAAGHNVTVIYE